MNGTFEVDFEACDLYHANKVRKNGQRDESAMIGKACHNAHYYTIYGVLNVYVF